MISRPGGTIKDERSLLGNTRLDEVCPDARARGLRSGQTIASARARCSELRVRVVPLGSVRAALDRIAEALLAFGATTSSDLDSNVVWVDVTGCAHLHQSDHDVTGERTLLSRIRAFVTSMRHTCAVAMADGPKVAAAVARYSTQRAEPIVVPSGQSESREAIAALPLAALPLPSEATRWLVRLGMRTVKDLQRLPRASLALRLGASSASVLALLEGADTTPLTPYVPPDVPEEIATLEYGISATEALLFVVKGLADRMAHRLAGRVMAATRLELVLGLDRALVASEPRAILDLRLASPLMEAAEMLGVLRSRVESFTIEAPILTVTLRVLEMAPRKTTPMHLFVPEAKAERALPRLVAELEAELGPGRVGTLILTHRWLPDERSHLVPIGTAGFVVPRTLPNPSSPRGSLLSGASEPTRFLGAPILAPSCRHEPQLFVRLELIEWWNLTVPRRTRCDYGMAWVDALSAVAWLSLEHPEGPAWVRGWMD